MKFRSVRSFCRMHISNRKTYFIISALITLIGIVMISKTMIMYYQASYNLSDIKKVFGNRTADMFNDMPPVK